MRGHTGIIKMRKNGLAPTLINIDDFGFDSPMANWEEHDHVPTVCVHKDLVEILDLRFLINMRVNITSSSEIRVKQLFTVCKKAGARWVAGSHTYVVGERVITGWMELWHG